MFFFLVISRHIALTLFLSYFDRYWKLSKCRTLLLRVPLVPWRNSTPFFGTAAICMTKIDDFRASLKLTSLTTLSSPSSKHGAGETHSLSGKLHPHHFGFQNTYIIIKVFGQPSSATYWHEQSALGRSTGDDVSGH